MAISKTRKVATIGMFCALAYITMMVIKIPVVAFLKYEPKDVIITICGLIFGPLMSLAVSVIVSFVEMITVSDTGIIGFFMNILSTSAFACTASLIYRNGKSVKSAIIGLFSGVVVMAIVMILWNYIITPIYMGIPRADIVGMLAPVFLTFNLLKGFLNAALTYLLYNPVIKGLRAAHLVPKSTSDKPKKVNTVLIIVSAGILITGTFIILAMNKII